MRNLTGTLCLTLFIILGSAGVCSASSEIAEERALDYAGGELDMHEGINELSNGKKYVLSIGRGESIAEALCAAVSGAADIMSQRIDPKVLERMMNLSQSGGGKKEAFNSSAPTPTPTLSARMRILMGQPSKTSIMKRNKETFASKFRIQSVLYSKRGTVISEISIKSLKENLTCFSFDSETAGYEFNYEFKSEGISFTKFLEEIRTAGYMKLFTGIKEKDRKAGSRPGVLAPGFAIIFASNVSRWQN
jgi:hypothetical protein